MKKHSPEQWERINAFIKKAKAEKRVPESYYAHVKCEIELTAWEAFANLKAEMMSINPFVQLKYLLTRKTPEVEPNKDMRGCASRALIEVAKLGQVERGQGIINDLGANVNYMDGYGRTPLYYAIARKRLGMAEMLLKNGADSYLQNKDSLGAFNLACAMGMWQAIPLFMKYGVDINRPREVKNWNRFHLGYRIFYAHPLGIAISQDQPKVCQTLLDKGAKLDLEIKKGFTIRDFAENNWDDFSPKMKQVFAPILDKPSEVLSEQKKYEIVPLSHYYPEVVLMSRKIELPSDMDVSVEIRIVQQELNITPKKISRKITILNLSGSSRERDE